MAKMLVKKGGKTTTPASPEHLRGSPRPARVFGVKGRGKQWPGRARGNHVHFSPSCPASTVLAASSRGQRQATCGPASWATALPPSRASPQQFVSSPKVGPGT